MRYFTGLLNMFCCDPLVKTASPFLRKVLTKYPNMLVTPDLLRMFGNRPLKSNVVRAVNNAAPKLRMSGETKRGIVRAMRTRMNGGISDTVLRMEQDAANDAFNSAAKKLGTRKFTVKQYFDSLIDKPKDVDTVGSLNEAYRKIGKVKRKATSAKMKLDEMTKTLDSVSGRQGISFEDFIGQYPQGEYIFKGGRFEQPKWDIRRGAFFSGRPDVALGYVQSPEASGLQSNLFSVARLSDSKSFRKGSTFFTPVVGSVKKQTRLLGRYVPGNDKSGHLMWPRFSNYEIVIPGHEARNIPVDRFRVYELPNVGLKSGANASAASGVKFVPESSIPRSVIPFFDARRHVAKNAYKLEMDLLGLRRYIKNHSPAYQFKYNTFFPDVSESASRILI